MKKALFATLLAAPLLATAQNPVIRHLFTADSTDACPTTMCGSAKSNYS